MLVELLSDLQLVPQAVDPATESAQQRHNISYRSVSLGIDSSYMFVLPYEL
jgi:hypothetical protein